MKNQEYSNWRMIKDSWYFIKDYKKQFIFFSILLAIAFSIELLPALILAKVVNFFVEGNRSLNYFYTLLAGFLGVFLVGTSLRLYSKYKLELISNNIQNGVKTKSFSRMMQGSLTWHDQEKAGNKIERIHSGENAIQLFLSWYIHRGISQIVLTIGILGVFAYFGMKYFIFSLIFLVIALTVELKLSKKVKEKSLGLKKVQEEAAGMAFEISSNISSVKSLGIEKNSDKSISYIEQKVLSAKNSSRKAGTIKAIARVLITNLFFALFLLMAGKDIIAGAFTVGVFVIYIDYFQRLGKFLGEFAKEVNNLIKVKIGLMRLMEIFDTIPEISEPNAQNLKSWRKIKFQDVTFSYGGDDRILNNFNLEIKKGEKIGVVGKSGSGKSTFLKLLLKLYSVNEGDIYFDNKSIDRIKRDSILEKISYVPQETELFNLSIEENIMISRQKKDMNRYGDVLKISTVGNFLPKFKLGGKTILGERGTRISGGERQRLGFARALYRDSNLLILDEATSNLDYETENKIIKNLSKLKEKTMIISAHRVQTLKKMDRIIFIEKGEIIEEGSYNELVKMKGAFYKLLKSQKGKN